MTDRLVLSGMRFFAYHGVLPEERAQGQEFLVDVELECVDRRHVGAGIDARRVVEANISHG